MILLVQICQFAFVPDVELLLLNLLVEALEEEEEKRRRKEREGQRGRRKGKGQVKWMGQTEEGERPTSKWSM